MSDPALSPADAAVVEQVVQTVARTRCDGWEHSQPCSRCVEDTRVQFAPLLALVVAARGQSARERQERLRASGTHWDGCEAVHLDCAVEALVAARAGTAKMTLRRDALLKWSSRAWVVLYRNTMNGSQEYDDLAHAFDHALRAAGGGQ